jgi:benzoyl-CoA reductase subunit C
VIHDLCRLAESVSNPFVEEWAKIGKPVLGYICSYIPRELISAAGILPYRIRGGGCGTTSRADIWMADTVCPFSRACLELALKGEYHFIGGLVSMNACECMRRMCDNWAEKAPVPYFYYMSVPYKSDSEAIDWYAEELRIFTKSLEAHFNLFVSAGDVWHAIDEGNKSRSLLQQLNRLKKSNPPPVSGAQAHKIAVLSAAMPADRFNAMLETAIQGLSPESGSNISGTRLMVLGSPLDDTAFTAFIEDSGGLVVADASCFGEFSFQGEIRTGDDPWNSLAEYYLSDVSCPRMPSTSKARLELIKRMAAEYDVEGIIFERMMFCNLWGGESMPVISDLKSLGIPLLVLDREYGKPGQSRELTRIEAFIEMIKGV